MERLCQSGSPKHTANRFAAWMLEAAVAFFPPPPNLLVFRRSKVDKVWRGPYYCAYQGDDVGVWFPRPGPATCPACLGVSWGLCAHLTIWRCVWRSWLGRLVHEKRKKQGEEKENVR